MSVDQANKTALVVFIEFEELAGAEEILANEPLNKAGLYLETHINRWINGLNRTPETLPHHAAKSYWHFNGYGKLNIHT